MAKSTMELWLPEKYKQDHTIKLPTPQTGEKYGGGMYGGPGIGQQLYYTSLPGGGMLMFDLSRLTMQDYRQMCDHYQVTISLWILEFMLHQVDWEIVCDRQDIADKIDENLREHWPRLIHAISTSFWAGYSPNVLQYENETREGKLPVRLDKIKDLIPETAEVHWKEIQGYNPQGPNTVAPKIHIYDGIDLRNQNFPIPAESTFWYPLLMQNGDYSGRKLLRPAFPAYFFSQLMHLFANRYFERFGEPVPIGRYPSGETANIGQGDVPARDAMETILANLRNRSVVTLPSDRDPGFVGTAGATAFDWDIEYLESQMRGADFERYLIRLDEEISLALFTPVLMYRTSSVGSYNLGDVHYRLFLTMLNAIAGDIKLHIDRYILDRLVDINYGVNAPRARWVARRLGRDTAETVRTVAQASIAGGFAIPDLEELSIAAGMEFHKPAKSDLPPASPMEEKQLESQEELGREKIRVQEEASKRQAAAAKAGGRGSATPNHRQPGSSRPRRVSTHELAEAMSTRAWGQFEKHMREETLRANTKLDLGHEKQLRQVVGAEPAAAFFDRFDSWWEEYLDWNSGEALTESALHDVIAFGLESLSE
jgi:hypothetical protein